MAGGLSTYGIISLREPVDVSLAEAGMIQALGVRIETNSELGKDFTLEELLPRFDAVFLGIGLGATNEMKIAGEEWIVDGLDYIEQSKLSPSTMRIGRHVSVIGAGNTSIDCATVAKRLGAERVTMIYRRTPEEMTAYPHEFEFVKKEGVEFRFLTQPIGVIGSNGNVTGLRCLRMELGEPDASGRRSPRPISGSEFTIETDQIVKAVGQKKPAIEPGLKRLNGFLQVDRNLQTSMPGVWAGGDSIRAKGAASTVMAVQDGKVAAVAIHQKITQELHQHG